MPLTAIAITRIVPAEKAFKRADAGGLDLPVKPNGSLLWRLDYRFDGRRKTLAFGSYPTTTLAEARAARDFARKNIDARRDPAVVRSNERKARQVAAINTFKSVSDRDIQKREVEGLSPHAVAALRRHMNEANRNIGAIPISQVDSRDVLILVRRIEARGISALKFRAGVSRVFRFAIAEGLATTDPAAPLVDALVTKRVVHHPCYKDPVAIGRLLVTIDS